MPVADVFTAEETRAFLAERTALADDEEAAKVVSEQGYLPLALAQAAAVIAGQQLSYETYLERLRRCRRESAWLPNQDSVTRLAWQRRCSCPWTRPGRVTSQAYPPR